MSNELALVPIWAWIILITILTVQGIWIFNDASKRNMNKWLWGFFGLLNSPTNLIIYLIVSRMIIKSKKCPACGRKINYQFTYCPHCGERQED